MQPLADISPIVPIALLAATALLFLQLPILTDILSFPYTFVRWIFTSGSRGKKKGQWSVVYDAKTKQPIDPAYVTVKNMLGVEVGSMITDLNGRFALILPRGLYTISVQKTNYVFPALSLQGKVTDGKYTDLYYGGTVEVTDAEQALTLSIPMDPTGTEDWNQAEKKRTNVALKVGKESHVTIVEVIYLAIGAILVAAHYLTYHDFLYEEIAAGYIILAGVATWRYFQPNHYAQSIIVDKNTNERVAFARVTVFGAAQKNQVSRKTASFEGEFTCLIANGNYYLTIERRAADGTYALAYTSPVFEVTNGAIDERFTI